MFAVHFQLELVILQGKEENQYQHFMALATVIHFYILSVQYFR